VVTEDWSLGGLEAYNMGEERAVKSSPPSSFPCRVAGVDGHDRR
jgi:hypothetical protein